MLQVMQDRDLSKIPFLPYKGLDGFGLKSPYWFWKQDGSCLQMVGYFSNKKGNFYLPTRTNVQTHISGFVASLPLHKATEKTVLTVQKTALLIPLSGPLCPTILRGFSPWICITHLWIGATDGLAQGQTLEPIMSICPHPAAAPRRCLWFWSSCQGAPPNCSSLGLLTAAFQLGLKTVSSWRFPTSGVLLQIGVQCFWELWMKEGREYPF